jgi:hypothetical protein
MPKDEDTTRSKAPPPVVPGAPGYRTRAGRGGLDPVDTYAEAGRMEDLFYQRLFTGRLRTRKPFYLLLMPLGAMFALPTGFAAGYATLTHPIFGSFLSRVLPFVASAFMAAVGVALLANLLASMVTILAKPAKSVVPPRQAERKPRKLPKRRKDYR